MADLGPDLPIDSIAIPMTKDWKRQVRQNIKNVILTTPWEHIAHNLFGVGIKRYLFEFPDSFGDLKSAIKEQLARWMRFVKITDMEVIVNGEEQRANFILRYYIGPLNEDDELLISIDDSNLYLYLNNLAQKHKEAVQQHFIPVPQDEVNYY